MATNFDFGLPSADSLFSTQEDRDDLKREKVLDIPLAEIDDFPEHPFKVTVDAEMMNMAESVKTYGVQTPAIVRQKDDGRHELISGHRRKMACGFAGLETMPCIVREMSRDEAVIYMVDSNLQREKILPSEKAYSYKMKLDAIKRKAGRPSKNNSVPVAQNLLGKTSREVIAESAGESQDQIRRYICLTELIPEILQMVDTGKIAFRPAVEISSLPRQKQKSLHDTMGMDDCTPSLAQAMKLKKFEQDGNLTDEVILSIMSEEKPNQVPQFKMPHERISRFFPTEATKAQIEDTIVKALELYRKRERERNAGMER